MSVKENPDRKKKKSTATYKGVESHMSFTYHVFYQTEFYNSDDVMLLRLIFCKDVLFVSLFGWLICFPCKQST